ncbi:MAG: hypothetical protein AB7K09_22320 [Planctomycetota bacterium]
MKPSTLLSGLLVAAVLLGLAAAVPQSAAAQGIMQAGTNYDPDSEVHWTAGFTIQVGNHAYRADDLEGNGGDIPLGGLSDSNRYPATDQVIEYGLAFTRPGKNVSGFFTIGLLDYKDEFQRSFDTYGYFGQGGFSWTMFRSGATPSISFGIGASGHVMISRLASGGTFLNAYLWEVPMFTFLSFEIVENFFVSAMFTVTLKGNLTEGTDAGDPQGFGTADRELFYREKRLLGIGIGVSYCIKVVMLEAELRLLNDTIFIFRAGFAFK